MAGRPSPPPPPLGHTLPQDTGSQLSNLPEFGPVDDWTPGGTVPPNLGLWVGGLGRDRACLTRPSSPLPQWWPCNATPVTSPPVCPAVSPPPPAAPTKPCAKPHSTPWRSVSGQGGPGVPGSELPPALLELASPGTQCQRAATTLIMSPEGSWSKQPGCPPRLPPSRLPVVGTPFTLAWESLGRELPQPMGHPEQVTACPWVSARGGRRKGPWHEGTETWAATPEWVLCQADGQDLEAAEDRVSGQPDGGAPCPQCTPFWGTPR